MGFAKGFVDLAIFGGFPGLRLSKRLTDKEWAAMEQHAVEAARRHEQLCLDRFLRKAKESKECIISKYRSWYECRDPGNEFWPPPFDIWTIPAIEDSLVEVLKSNLHHLQGLPHWSSVPDIILDSLVHRFEDIANNHSMSSKMGRLELVPEELRLPSARETLELARTLFVRLSDSSIIRYPRLTDQSDWCWNELGSTVMSDIIILAGHDPNTMTFAQLLEEDIWVECLTCAQADQEGKVVQAVEAVMHCHIDHGADATNKQSVEWRILEGLELVLTRVLNTRIKKWWKCLLCGYESVDNENSVLRHISWQ
ncbi:uncharacterized protein EI90DRAFT_1879550 [Cantharellus anzutake]|uniref:uncharacterized protein n=1 Tax=Cantharellus anzutake TaxID=1750568 RepID=UPI0019040521|nr:uncharacterized protein EI90DRAFT_1879550 [Cantharellus anzutake]KAF8326852.1 hypothetical protein EI90DRAFT_1879550 [Cantharellus anzutake]